MKTLMLLSLVLFLSPVSASFSRGEYTSLDFFGTPPPLNAQEREYIEFLKRTKKGGTLNVPTFEPMEIVYPSAFQKGVQKKFMPYWNEYVYEPLMGSCPYRPSRQVDAGIAKSVEADPENKTYVIHLRDDVKFSDGTPVTADDVPYSYHEKIVEFGGEVHKGYYENVWGAHPEIKVLSKYQLQVSFPEIAVEKQREAIVQFLSDIKIVKPNTATDPAIQLPMPYLGTGPYRVVRAEREFARIERRDDYWRKDSPAFNYDRINTTTFRDRVVQREALKRHDINFLDESSPQAEREADEGVTQGLYKKTEVPIPTDQIELQVMAMNLSRPFLKDLAVRRALVTALDFGEPQRIIFAGKITNLAAPGIESSFSPKGLPNDEVKELLKGDPEVSDLAINTPYEKLGYLAAAKIAGHRERLLEAARILKEGGYVLDPATRRLMKDGQPVNLVLLTWSGTAYMGLHEFMKQELERLGISVDLHRAADLTAELADMRRGAYDFVQTRMEIPYAFRALDFDILTQRFHSKYAANEQINNSSHLRSPAFDRVLDLLHDSDAPVYAPAAEAFLRLLSAKLPFFMLGERTKEAVFADSSICFPPNTNWLVESSYFCGRRGVQPTN